MLQREIMFKQLKELHGMHQLQELGDTRNQDYVNQLSSLKQASAVQFAPRVNRAPVHNSQMFTAGNMQMMQCDGSGILQQLSNGLILSQSHNHALGPMGVSLPESDINLNLYSHLQGRSNHSATLLTKNDNSPLDISAMHPSTFASSLISQQGNISDQISISDSPWQPNEVFQENYLFAQVPVHSLNSDILSLTDSRQGITMFRNPSALESEGRHVDTGAHGSSPGKVSNASLDPLEQKILYNTDDGSWRFSFGRSNKTGTGDSQSTVENQSCMDTFPSIQSGSWTALMHSAVAETYSPDTAIQDEWSGLSFQKPEQSTDNQLSNFTTSENQQTDWTERNLQNIVPPSSEPKQLFQKSNVNCGFPGSHALGYESRGTLWLHRSTSNSVSNGIHQPFNQVDQLNIQRYSVESEKMVPGDNVEPMSDLLGASAVSQHFELPTALSTSWPYITTQEDVPSPKPSRCSANLFHSPDSASCIQEASSGAPNEQHNQVCPGNKRNIQEFGTCSGKSEYHELPLERSFSLHGDSTELHNPISVSRTTHRQESFRMHQSEADRVAPGSMMSCTFQQPSNHAKQKDNGTAVLPVRDIRAFAHSLHQNYSLLHQMHSREAAYQQAITNGRELLLSGEKLAVNDKAKSDLEEVQLGATSLGDQSGKALSASPRNFQQKEIFNQNGSESCSNSNEVSNVAYQSLISLQMAPSWCKQYGTLNNGQMRPMYIPKPAINAGQPFSGLTLGKLQENSFIMQVNSANTSQGSGELQSSASTLIANKHLSPSGMLSSDVYQDLALPKPKKRKSVAFDMVTWNKEVNEEPLRLQNIRLDRSLSIVDIKIESQEVEKFSTYNRFAKFHVKTGPSTVDPASSSGPSIVQKTRPQPYVIALPMPGTIPEGSDCLSL